MNTPEKNWLEWAVFAVGLVLVGAALGYLVYDAATFGNAPPDIEVRLDAPAQQRQHFTVPVTVINHGDLPAEGVRVEVVLEASGAEEPERAELEIPLLPRGASREGAVAFRRDPRTAQLTARLLGYEKP
ncbi:MAG: hypothetical protein H0W76_05085 [Pyrinomonadaceae bacterium]|nr:hypothetical protein [Pyrinomonadaceae bacterium]